jgi:hypothetical protein
MANERKRSIVMVRPMHHLHERQIAELFFVSGYYPLALLHHAFDRLKDAWVCLADFLDLKL